MEIDAEMRRKIAVSVGAVVVFIALLVLIGLQYTDGHDLSEIGGYYFVGAMGLFILLMAAAGLFLDRGE
jgi:FtsH-binding integral membrane protein